MRPMLLGGLRADEHECAFDVLRFEDVEDLWRPLGIGAVVEGERNLVGMVAVLLDGIGVRIDIHVLVDDELLARVGLVGVDSTVRLPGWGRPVMRRMSPSPSVSTSWPGCTVPSACSDAGIAGMVPDIPQRTVFFAETPQSEGLQAELAGGAQLIEDGDARRGTTLRGADCCLRRCTQSAD